MLVSGFPNRSFYSFVRYCVILMAKFITSTLNVLIILSCRNSMISGLRKHDHRWHWSQSQRLSMKLVHILALFQINGLGRVVGTWAVEPYAKGQVGERSWDFFPCKYQQLEKMKTTLRHRWWEQTRPVLGRDKEAHWSKRNDEQEPWEGG